MLRNGLRDGRLRLDAPTVVRLGGDPLRGEPECPACYPPRRGHSQSRAPAIDRVATLGCPRGSLLLKRFCGFRRPAADLHVTSGAMTVLLIAIPGNSCSVLPGGAWRLAFAWGSQSRSAFIAFQTSGSTRPAQIWSNRSLRSKPMRRRRYPQLFPPRGV
jgi:hypothetical protein